MAIRFKNYQDKNRKHSPLKALRITEKNIHELATYICKNGGAAFVTDSAGTKPPRIRLKQRNFGENWGKRDWRVARIGDFILMDHVAPEHQEKLGKREFWRAKDDYFESTHDLVK